MTKLLIKDDLAEMLNYFGEPSKIVNFALHNYLVRSCQERIDRAKRTIELYERKYKTNW